MRLDSRLRCQRKSEHIHTARHDDITYENQNYTCVRELVSEKTNKCHHFFDVSQLRQQRDLHDVSMRWDANNNKVSD